MPTGFTWVLHVGVRIWLRLLQHDRYAAERKLFYWKQ